MTVINLHASSVIAHRRRTHTNIRSKQVVVVPQFAVDELGPALVRSADDTVDTFHPFLVVPVHPWDSDVYYQSMEQKRRGLNLPVKCSCVHFMELCCGTISARNREPGKTRYTIAPS